MDVVLGGHHNTEYQDEEHTQLEGFGQVAHLRAEGGDDGEGGDGQDDDEFVELARDEQ